MCLKCIYGLNKRRRPLVSSAAAVGCRCATRPDDVMHTLAYAPPRASRQRVRIFFLFFLKSSSFMLM